MQSTRRDDLELHVGIIMDGNGRWATARGLSRAAGHRRGAEAVRRAVEAAPALGVRCPDAVRVLVRQLAAAGRRGQRPDVPLREVPRPGERPPRGGRRALERRGPPRSTSRVDRPGDRARRRRRPPDGSTLLLRVAIDYSARQAIAVASSLPALPGCEPVDDFARRLELAIHSVAGVPAGRSGHPNQRRAAALGLPALGIRLRRARLPAGSLARLRRGGARRGGGELPPARSTVRSRCRRWLPDGRPRTGPNREPDHPTTRPALPRRSHDRTTPVRRPLHLRLDRRRVVHPRRLGGESHEPVQDRRRPAGRGALGRPARSGRPYGHAPPGARDDRGGDREG